MNVVKRNQLKYATAHRSFAGLMDVYERNYHLLGQLLPDLDKLPDSLVSKVPDSLDLHLDIIERCKYTTTVLLTYYFPDKNGVKVADPGLTIKLYHDTHQAEALACMKTGFMSVEHSNTNREPYMDCRWESNMFVEKWLRFSLQQGHHFTLDNIDNTSSEHHSSLTECI